MAVAIDGRGVRLDEKHVPVAVCGYEELERWSRSLGQIHAFGIEGTGSYGAGLARFLTDRSHAVVEVNRPDRSVRYRKGKSDPTDAEMAPRAVLAGVADAIPKSGEGEVEMIRMLKGAKDSAIKARTQAVNQMIGVSSRRLRETLAGLTTIALITRCKPSVLVVWTTPRRRRSTHFDRLPAVIVDSMKRFRSWRSSWNDSPKRQRPPWLTPSA